MTLTKVPESMISKAFGTAAEDDTSTILASALSAAQAGDAAVAAANPFVNGLLHIRHEVASGTDGGTFTAGSWVTRPLNAVKTNQVAGASLASNQVTLPAGTYLCMAHSMAYKVQHNKVRIYDVTNAAVLLEGLNNFADASSSGSQAGAFGVFTIAAETVIELQHRCSVSQATNGLGTSNTFGNEVFADLMLWKLA